MATMRPVLKDFSAGQVDRGMDARCDLTIHARTSRKLSNLKPMLTGGFRRRGGMKMLATLSGDARIIPWSVQKGLDLLVVIYDRSIALFNVTDGTAVAALVSSNLPITAIDSTHQTYSLVDAWDVKYAVAEKQIYLAHPDYPLFQIKFVSYNYDEDTSSYVITLSYGKVTLTGNIAYSPVKTEETLKIGDAFAASTFIGKMQDLSQGKTYTATGYINGHPISTVKKNVTTRARKANMSLSHWARPDIPGTWIYDSADKIPLVNPVVYQDTFLSVRNIGGSSDLFVKKFTGAYGGGSTDGRISCTEFLDWLEAAYNSGSIFEEHPYALHQYIKLDLDADGSVKFVAAKNDLITVTVTFSDGTATATYTPDSPSMTGYCSVLAEDSSEIIRFNSYEVSASSITDNCSPWMTPEVPYPCDSSTKFDGGYPISAVRILGGNVYSDDGTLISSGDAGIKVFFSGNKPSIFVSKDNTGRTGSLGVIVTPFFKAGDNPGFVAVHQGRLVLGGSRYEPNTFYLSKSNDLTNFCFFEEVSFQSTSIASYDDDGNPVYVTEDKIIQQIGASSAIKMRVVTEENETLQWAVSMTDLLLATQTSEFVVPANITALSPSITLFSRNGSAEMQGRFIGQSVLFASYTRDKLCSFTPQNGAASVTDMAKSLFSGKIKSIDFRQNPDQEVYVVLEDGTAVVGIPSADVIGWMPIETRAGDSIRSIATVSRASEDTVFLAVKRGSTYYLEELLTNNDSSFLGRNYLDGSTTGVSTADQTITGATRFYGESGVLVVFSNGLWGTPVISAAGVIATFIPEATVADPTPTPLAVPASRNYHLGYRYDSSYESHLLETPETEYLAKSGSNVYFRVIDSGNFHLIYLDDFGVEDNDMLVETPEDSSGVRIYPYSGVEKSSYMAPSKVDHTVIVETSGPESLNILAVAPVLETGDIL